MKIWNKKRSKELLKKRQEELKNNEPIKEEVEPANTDTAAVPPKQPFYHRIKFPKRQKRNYKYATLRIENDNKDILAHKNFIIATKALNSHKFKKPNIENPKTKISTIIKFKYKLISATQYNQGYPGIRLEFVYVESAEFKHLTSTEGMNKFDFFQATNLVSYKECEKAEDTLCAVLHFYSRITDEQLEEYKKKQTEETSEQSKTNN